MRVGKLDIGLLAMTIPLGGLALLEEIAAGIASGFLGSKLHNRSNISYRRGTDCQ
jgi:hypothetical protein